MDDDPPAAPRLQRSRAPSLVDQYINNIIPVPRLQRSRAPSLVDQYINPVNPNIIDPLDDFEQYTEDCVDEDTEDDVYDNDGFMLYAQSNQL